MKGIFYFSMCIALSGCVTSNHATALVTWHSQHCDLRKRLDSAILLVPINTPLAKAKQTLGNPTGTSSTVVFGKGVAYNAEYEFDNGTICLSLRHSPEQIDTDKMTVTFISAVEK